MFSRVRLSPAVGQLACEWRVRRRLRQPDLSIQAQISTANLNFLETGRSTPTPGLILRLSEGCGTCQPE
ncbi:MAG TPA: helix-turn-helix transcriptional regulator [Mycobacterium sp.]